MLGYAARRLIMLLPVCLGVLVLTFFLLQLIPGDPAVALSGPNAPPEVVEELRVQMGLDKSLPVQFGLYLLRVVRGDLGVSILSRLSVSSEIHRVFGATMELTIASMAWSVPLAVLAGIVSAVTRGSLIDKGMMALALMGVSLPLFWVGLMLIWLLGFQLNWLPISGRGATWTLDGLRHLTLPALTLGANLVGRFSRVTRATVLEVLRQDYIRTARAKGVAERVVLYRHALRNAALPIVTLIGLQFGWLLGGAVVTETVFSWPGMGRHVIKAILAKDYPMAQGIILVMAMLFVLINLGVDLLYAALDPRVKYT